MQGLFYLQDKNKYGNQQEWTVEINGVEVKCYAIRSSITNVWCGYVEIGDMKVDIDKLDVHGGITGGSGTSVGFDCAHCNDWTPKSELFAQPGEKLHYWTFPEVKDETIRLAKQIY